MKIRKKKVGVVEPMPPSNTTKILTAWIKRIKEERDEESLSAVLQEFALFSSSFPKSDLTLWTPVLNRLDALLERTIRKYSLGKPGQMDFPSPIKRLLMSILHFQRSLLENSFNRSNYNSVDRLIVLMEVPDLDVMEASMRLLLLVIGRLSSHKHIKPFTNHILHSVQGVIKEWSPFVSKAPPDKAPHLSAHSCQFAYSVDDSDEKNNDPINFSLAIPSEMPVPSSIVQSFKQICPPSASSDDIKLALLRRCVFVWNAVSLHHQVSATRLLMLATFFQLSPSTVSSSLPDTDPNTVLAEVDSLLASPYQLPAIKSASLNLLSGLCKSHMTKVVSRFNLTTSHGLIAVILRDILSKNMTVEDSQDFLGSFFHFCSVVVANPSGGSCFILSGSIPLLVRLLDKETGLFSVKVISILDNILTGYPTAYSTFSSAGGTTIVIKAVDVLVNSMIAAESPSPIHGMLLKGCLKTIFHLLQGGSSGSEGLRNLVDTPLPVSLQKIFQHSALFGPSRFVLGLNILTTIIHNEPTSLTILQELKVPQSLIGSLLSGILVSSDVAVAIPHALGALCLNSSGLAMVSESNVLKRYFYIFTDPSYIPYLMDPDSIGASLDELVRHHPSLRDTVTSDLLSIIDRIIELGSTVDIGINTQDPSALPDGIPQLSTAEMSSPHYDTEDVFFPFDFEFSDKCKSPCRVTLVPSLSATSHDVKMIPKNSRHDDDDDGDDISHTPRTDLFAGSIELVAIMIELFFVTPPHRQMFVKEGGLDKLLRLYSLEGLPYDFCISPESYSLSHLIGTLAEENPGLLAALIWENISTILEKIHNSCHEKGRDSPDLSSSFYAKYVDLIADKATIADTSHHPPTHACAHDDFRHLVYLLSILRVAGDVFSGSSWAIMGSKNTSSTKFNSSCLEYLRKDMMVLYRLNNVFQWFVVEYDTFKTAVPSQWWSQLSSHKTSSADPTDRRVKNARSLKFLLAQIPSTIITLFSALGKMASSCLGRCTAVKNDHKCDHRCQNTTTALGYVLYPSNLEMVLKYQDGKAERMVNWKVCHSYLSRSIVDLDYRDDLYVRDRLSRSPKSSILSYLSVMFRQLSVCVFEDFHDKGHPAVLDAFLDGNGPKAIFSALNIVCSVMNERPYKAVSASVKPDDKQQSLWLKCFLDGLHLVDKMMAMMTSRNFHENSIVDDRYGKMNMMLEMVEQGLCQVWSPGPLLPDTYIIAFLKVFYNIFTYYGPLYSDRLQHHNIAVSSRKSLMLLMDGWSRYISNKTSSMPTCGGVSIGVLNAMASVLQLYILHEDNNKTSSNILSVILDPLDSPERLLLVAFLLSQSSTSIIVKESLVRELRPFVPSVIALLGHPNVSMDTVTPLLLIIESLLSFELVDACRSKKCTSADSGAENAMTGTDASMGDCRSLFSSDLVDLPSFQEEDRSFLILFIVTLIKKAASSNVLSEVLVYSCLRCLLLLTRAGMIQLDHDTIKGILDGLMNIIHRAPFLCPTHKNSRFLVGPLSSVTYKNGIPIMVTIIIRHLVEDPFLVRFLFLQDLQERFDPIVKATKGRLGSGHQSLLSSPTSSNNKKHYDISSFFKLADYVVLRDVSSFSAILPTVGYNTPERRMPPVEKAENMDKSKLDHYCCLYVSFGENDLPSIKESLLKKSIGDGLQRCRSILLTLCSTIHKIKHQDTRSHYVFCYLLSLLSELFVSYPFLTTSIHIPKQEDGSDRGSSSTTTTIDFGNSGIENLVSLLIRERFVYSKKFLLSMMKEKPLSTGMVIVTDLSMRMDRQSIHWASFFVCSLLLTPSMADSSCSLKMAILDMIIDAIRTSHLHPNFMGRICALGDLLTRIISCRSMCVWPLTTTNMAVDDQHQEGEKKDGQDNGDNDSLSSSSPIDVIVGTLVYDKDIISVLTLSLERVDMAHPLSSIAVKSVCRLIDLIVAKVAPKTTAVSTSDTNTMTSSPESDAEPSRHHGVRRHFSEIDNDSENGRDANGEGYLSSQYLTSGSYDGHSEDGSASNESDADQDSLSSVTMFITDDDQDQDDVEIVSVHSIDDGEDDDDESETEMPSSNISSESDIDHLHDDNMTIEQILDRHSFDMSHHGHGGVLDNQDDAHEEEEESVVDVDSEESDNEDRDDDDEDSLREGDYRSDTEMMDHHHNDSTLDNDDCEQDDNHARHHCLGHLDDEDIVVRSAYPRLYDDQDYIDDHQEQFLDDDGPPENIYDDRRLSFVRRRSGGPTSHSHHSEEDWDDDEEDGDGDGGEDDVDRHQDNAGVAGGDDNDMWSDLEEGYDDENHVGGMVVGNEGRSLGHDDENDEFHSVGRRQRDDNYGSSSRRLSGALTQAAGSGIPFPTALASILARRGPGQDSIETTTPRGDVIHISWHTAATPRMAGAGRRSRGGHVRFGEHVAPDGGEPRPLAILDALFPRNRDANRHPEDEPASAASSSSIPHSLTNIREKKIVSVVGSSLPPVLLILRSLMQGVDSGSIQRPLRNGSEGPSDDTSEDLDGDRDRGDHTGFLLSSGVVRVPMEGILSSNGEDILASPDTPLTLSASCPGFSSSVMSSAVALIERHPFFSTVTHDPHRARLSASTPLKAIFSGSIDDLSGNHCRMDNVNMIAVDDDMAGLWFGIVRQECQEFVAKHGIDVLKMLFRIVKDMPVSKDLHLMDTVAISPDPSEKDPFDKKDKRGHGDASVDDSMKVIIDWIIDQLSRWSVVQNVGQLSVLSTNRRWLQECLLVYGEVPSVVTNIVEKTRLLILDSISTLFKDVENFKCENEGKDGENEGNNKGDENEGGDSLDGAGTSSNHDAPREGASRDPSQEAPSGGATDGHAANDQDGGDDGHSEDGSDNDNSRNDDEDEGHPSSSPSSSDSGDDNFPVLYIMPEMDATVLEALPEDMQRDVLSQYFYERRQNNPGRLLLAITPEYLEGIQSNEIRDLILQVETEERRQYRREQRQRRRQGHASDNGRGDDEVMFSLEDEDDARVFGMMDGAVSSSHRSPSMFTHLAESLERALGNMLSNTARSSNDRDSPAPPANSDIFRPLQELLGTGRRSRRRLRRGTRGDHHSDAGADQEDIDDGQSTRALATPASVQNLKCPFVKPKHQEVRKRTSFHLCSMLQSCAKGILRVTILMGDDDRPKSCRKTSLRLLSTICESDGMAGRHVLELLLMILNDKVTTLPHLESLLKTCTGSCATPSAATNALSAKGARNAGAAAKSIPGGVGSDGVGGRMSAGGGSSIAARALSIIQYICAKTSLGSFFVEPLSGHVTSHVQRRLERRDPRYKRLSKAKREKEDNRHGEGGISAGFDIALGRDMDNLGDLSLLTGSVVLASLVGEDQMYAQNGPLVESLLRVLQQLSSAGSWSLPLFLIKKIVGMGQNLTSIKAIASHLYLIQNLASDGNYETILDELYACIGDAISALVLELSAFEKLLKQEASPAIGEDYQSHLKRHLNEQDEPFNGTQVSAGAPSASDASLCTSPRVENDPRAFLGKRLVGDASSQSLLLRLLRSVDLVKKHVKEKTTNAKARDSEMEVEKNEGISTVDTSHPPGESPSPDPSRPANSIHNAGLSRLVNLGAFPSMFSLVDNILILSECGKDRNEWLCHIPSALLPTIQSVFIIFKYADDTKLDPTEKTKKPEEIGNKDGGSHPGDRQPIEDGGHGSFSDEHFSSVSYDKQDANRHAQKCLLHSCIDCRLCLSVFVERHKDSINGLVRQRPVLLETSMNIMASMPCFSKMLDFDIKKNFFTRLLHKKTSSHASGLLPIYVTVRRTHVFEDSFRQIMSFRGADVKYGRLSVTFHDEEGVDAGGVAREWFSVLSRQMFNPDYALFRTSAVDRITYQPNRSSHVNPDHLMYFQFVGRVIGKAIYDGRLLDCYFTRSFYKHILGVAAELRDMEAVDPSFYKSLVWILENDITDVLDLTFSTETDDFGVRKVVELVSNGRNIPVTEGNKKEYVRLVTQLKLTTAIQAQLDAFLKGLHEIIPAGLISIFSENELELLISGMPTIDIDDWRANCEYHGGYSSSSPQIVWFWRAVRLMSQEQRARLLQFATGTSKVPLEGFAALQGSSGVCKFQIHRDYGPTCRLPSAHTCFNQLDIPAYEDYETLRDSLLKAVNEGATGFGFA